MERVRLRELTEGKAPRRQRRRPGRASRTTRGPMTPAHLLTVCQRHAVKLHAALVDALPGLSPSIVRTCLEYIGPAYEHQFCLSGATHALAGTSFTDFADLPLMAWIIEARPELPSDRRAHCMVRVRLRLLPELAAAFEGAAKLYAPWTRWHTYRADMVVPTPWPPPRLGLFWLRPWQTVLHRQPLPGSRLELRALAPS